MLPALCRQVLARAQQGLLRRVPRQCSQTSQPSCLECLLVTWHVVVYLEVCDHKIPLGMSPVMQATGQRIEHNCYIYQLRPAWTSLSRFPAAVGQKQ